MHFASLIFMQRPVILENIRTTSLALAFRLMKISQASDLAFTCQGFNLDYWMRRLQVVFTVNNWKLEQFRRFMRKEKNLHPKVALRCGIDSRSIWSLKIRINMFAISTSHSFGLFHKIIDISWKNPNHHQIYFFKRSLN